MPRLPEPAPLGAKATRVNFEKTSRRLLGTTPVIHSLGTWTSRVQSVPGTVLSASHIMTHTYDHTAVVSIVLEQHREVQ